MTNESYIRQIEALTKLVDVLTNKDSYYKDDGIRCNNNILRNKLLNNTLEKLNNLIENKND